MLQYQAKLTYQNKQPTKVLSIWNPSARLYTAMLAAQGKPFGLYFRGVCAILGKGESLNFIQEISRIKGEERQHRPLSTILPAEQFVPMLDPARIAPDLQHIFLDPKELSARLGSLCFMRLPVQEEIARKLPPALLSYTAEGAPLLQSWDTNGHEAISLMIKEMQKQGIKIPAGTSMNYSGEPEIVDEEKAIAFSNSAGIAVFLTDGRDKKQLRGSYSILSVNEQGAKLERDGNIRGSLFSALIGCPVKEAGAKPAKYRQLDLPKDLIKHFTPSQLREAILLQI